MKKVIVGFVVLMLGCIISFAGTNETEKTNSVAPATSSSDLLTIASPDFDKHVVSGFAYVKDSETHYTMFVQVPIIDYADVLKLNFGSMHTLNNDGSYDDNFAIVSITLSLQKIIKISKLSIADIGVYYPIKSGSGFNDVQFMVGLIDLQF